MCVSVWFVSNMRNIYLISGHLSSEWSPFRPWDSQLPAPGSAGLSAVWKAPVPASLQSHRPIHFCRCMGCSSSKTVLASPEVSERLCSPDGSNLRPTLSAGAVLSFFPETNKTCFSILLGLKYLSPFFTGQKGGLLKPPKEGNHYRALQK